MSVNSARRCRVLSESTRANAARLPTDYMALIDGYFIEPGLPSLITGLRGLLYVEIEVVGPADPIFPIIIALFQSSMGNTSRSYQHTYQQVRMSAWAISSH